MTESALNQILKPGGITAMYQPVLHVADGATRLHSFECLSRGPKGTNFESAKILFEYVRLKREESLVDRACIGAALAGAASLPADARIALNVHASTLGRDHGFIPYLRLTAANANVELERLTIEIVEHAPPWDNVTFLAALAELRRLGPKIALDDVGLGQSNFKMLLDVAPDYLKIDQYFVTGCAKDERRRCVIRLLANLASDFRAEVVAEGIETEDDVKALQDLGVTLMQGFLFSAPLTLEEVTERLHTGRVPAA